MDKQKLNKDLTEFHVMVLYDFMCPIDYSIDFTAETINQRYKDAELRYSRDPVFHQRVVSLVAGTLKIVNKYEEQLILKYCNRYK